MPGKAAVPATREGQDGGTSEQPPFACYTPVPPRHTRLRLPPPLVLLLLCWVWPAVINVSPLAAATDEVGIDEKLGATLPADIELHDEAGQKVALRSLIDKPTVLTLNYFTCAGICTPQLNNLVQTLNQLELAPGEAFQVITVSFDPADTAAVAAAKRTNYLRLMKRPFPPLAWRFLTGDEASTKRVMDAVGFRVKRQGDSFLHAGALIILSPQARITRYMYGITYLPVDLQMALAEAATGLVRPTVSRALAFCYTYDPAGHKYVINITRVAGAVTLLFASVFAGLVLMKSRRRTERATT